MTVETYLDTVLQCKICEQTFPLEERARAEEHARMPIEDGLPEWFVLRGRDSENYFFYAKKNEDPIKADHQRTFIMIKYHLHLNRYKGNFFVDDHIYSAGYIKSRIEDKTLIELTEKEFDCIVPIFEGIAKKRGPRFGISIPIERQINTVSQQDRYFKDLQELEEAQRVTR